MNPLHERISRPALALMIAAILLSGGCRPKHEPVASAASVHRHAGAEPRIRPNRGPGSELPNALRLDFFRAATRGRLELARQLLARTPLLVDARPDNESRTPLISATWNDEVDMVKLLIARGADLEAEDYVWGGSALGWSGWFGRPAVAAVLIASGAEINHPNRGGCTPLCSAIAAQESQPNQGSHQATPAQRDVIIALFKTHGGVPRQERTRPWPIIEGWDDHPD